MQIVPSLTFEPLCPLKMKQPPSETIDPIRMLSRLAIPATLLVIIGSFLGYYTSQVVPVLQQVAPIETWPLAARLVVMAAPWCAAGAIAVAVTLGMAVLGDACLRGLAHSHTDMAAIVLPIIALAIVAYAYTSLRVVAIGQ